MTTTLGFGFHGFGTLKPQPLRGNPHSTLAARIVSQTRKPKPYHSPKLSKSRGGSPHVLCFPPPASAVDGMAQDTMRSCEKGMYVGIRCEDRNDQQNSSSWWPEARLPRLPPCLRLICQPLARIVKVMVVKKLSQDCDHYCGGAEANVHADAGREPITVISIISRRTSSLIIIIIPSSPQTS